LSIINNRSTRGNNIRASEICLESGPFTAIVGNAGRYHRDSRKTEKGLV